MAARPKLVRHTALLVPAATRWDVPSVRNALDAHDLGQFGQSALLADAMTRDDRYAAVLNTRVLGLLGCPLELEPSDEGDKRRSGVVARDASAALPETAFAIDAAANILINALQMGFAIAQLIWDTGEGDDPWSVTLKPWHPVFTYYRFDLRQYGVYTQEGAVEITPGDGTWFLYAPWGPYRAWMRGAVRHCALPYLSRQFTERDWQRYNEVHGLSPRKVDVPVDAANEEKMALYQSIIDMGSEAVLQLPKNPDGTGWDVNLLEAKGGGWKTFDANEEAQSKKFSVALLGQNLTTDVEGGSRAAAQVHDSVRQDYRDFDARTLSGAYREQVLKPWAEYNYGDRRLAPKACWKVEPPEDKKAKAETLVQVGTALTSFAAVAPEVDRRAMLEAFDVPLLKPEDVPAAAPAAPPAPGGDATTPPPATSPAPPAQAATRALRALPAIR